MIDLGQIVGFDWDDGNSRKNTKKHTVLESEAEQIFEDNGLVISSDLKHSQDEPRYHALGRTMTGRFLHVTFTLRDNETKIRVISARDVNRKERGAYGQKA